MFIIVDQFQFINTVDKGFDQQNTLVIKIPDEGFLNAERLEQSLLKVNGVKKTASSSFYTDEIQWTSIFEIDTENATKKTTARYEYWGHDFTGLINIEIVKGRDFDKNRAGDQYGAYLINETAASEFGWKDPIGRSISGPLTGHSPIHKGEVIGVVKDFNIASLHEKVAPMIIFVGTDEWSSEYLYVKLDPIRPKSLISNIETEYQKFYADSPFNWEFLDTKITSLYKDDYQVRNIFRIGLFISVLVSCLGIFSISAFLILFRAKEMGIRKIIGATQIHLFGLHIKNFIKFTVGAILIAWPITYYLSDHWLNNFAYRIDLNFWYFFFPGLITMVIILITSGFHGVKSSQVNPIDALKQE